MMQPRTIFYISDGTGITAEKLGHGLLSQFEHAEFENITLPFVNTPEKAKEAVANINSVYQQSDLKPIVFATMVNQDVAKIIHQSHGLLIDLFSSFIKPLEIELGEKSSFAMGRSHGVTNETDYKSRIDAVNFSLGNDDGAGSHNYNKADVILLGVSRSGKTPTCLYMALQYGVYAANYPFTPDDMHGLKLPEFLKDHKAKCFGLTIDAEQLQAIRRERRADSDYASARQCRLETAEVEQLYKKIGLPYVNTTTRSIEEIATKIMADLNIKRLIY